MEEFILNQIFNSIANNSGLFISVLIVISTLLLVFLIYTHAQLAKFRKKYFYLIGNDNKDKEGVPIAVLLEQYVSYVRQLDDDNKHFHNKLNIVSQKLENCFQKIGVVRYNPFDEIGGNFCFALALLDENDNGVVLNSIYSREGSYTYAKSIENGISTHSLSAEELQALDIARRKN